MDHEFHSIVEKLAILEGRIAPKDHTVAETTSKQKKPALFNNLKKEEKTDEDFVPMVGGVEFAEEKSDDVLSKVKASLADYLKSAEDSVKQDRELLKKKKEDLDIKKKELKDLELQQKKREQAEEVEEAIPMTLEGKLNVGDPIIVTAPNEYEGMTGEITEFSPSGKFVVVRLYNADEECSMHVSDVEYNQYADDQDEEDDLSEEPTQHPPQGEGQATNTNPSYAQGGQSTYASESAPVKTMNIPLDEMGGSVLVEIHGDERDGFCIKRAGKEMATRFKSLEEAEIALEMYQAHRAEQLAQAGPVDYIEEK